VNLDQKFAHGIQFQPRRRRRVAIRRHCRETFQMTG
jgi:hypothetical protein